ncbi:putative protein kinase CAMK-CDPK family [Helianthus annuus]|uniref:non-specific serine/threonine protein kinase n=1 Tax=Helianthus annuus TaxID=4232 RepID=A0A251VTL0_HELAN|nr:putative protein kinase CAMK-CDPK family [Helianthus annuus]
MVNPYKQPINSSIKYTLYDTVYRIRGFVNFRLVLRGNNRGVGRFWRKSPNKVQPALSDKHFKDPQPVQTTPPETPRLAKEEVKDEVKVEVKPEVRLEHKPSKRVSIVKQQSKHKQSVKKPQEMKRMLSAGLQADRLLKVNNGNLKDFYMLGHPNVVSIKGAYEDSISVYLVMELCAGGELFDRIIDKSYYSEQKAADLAKTIVSVIEGCHSLGVMHRDLKPENFLFVDDDEDSVMKIIDFGLSSFFKPGEIFTDVVGSPYYVAPEVLLKYYGPEADIWSAGVIIYVLLCGVPPFYADTEEDIFEEVLHGKLDFSIDPWPKISESAKDLVKKMLVRDRKKRITAHEVLCHPWISVDGVAPDKPLDPAVLIHLTRFSAMNKLKKMAVKVIASKLSEDEIAGLKQMFKMIDTDNSGNITFEELKIGLKNFGANLEEYEIHDLMQAADINNNGIIDYEEFVAATLHLNKVYKEDSIYAAFSYFDKDGSGFITVNEIQQSCKELGIDESQIDDIIKEADLNNDGRIDYNEFVAMMQKESAVVGRRQQKNNLKIGLREGLPVC